MSLTDDAIDQIKAMIVRGELRPGDRLPPEKDLAERLGLSRNSLREAVKALEVIRVVDVRRGDGTYVTSLEPALLLEAISFGLDLHNDRSVLELFAVRRMLEAQAAALAAQRVDADQIAVLDAEMASVDAETSVDDLVAHDVRLHRLIASFSGNRYLAGLIESLAANTVRARVWRGLTQEGAVERTLVEHTALVDALRAHDVERASVLASAHVSGVEEWLRRASAAQEDPTNPADRELLGSGDRTVSDLPGGAVGEHLGVVRP
ncbi:FadR/GntR family transcriptional regulator [uncultured Microbacterium sp.]|uniref:FadR/GntR family transcriptional regulator n=1 Tax=uncultured Microbacterium sp. TaxID=191216 RepID=UPI0028D1FCA0|nr:FadR/GntR family transcriptional regulator [uncultured Microbacterium sp.]